MLPALAAAASLAGRNTDRDEHLIALSVDATNCHRRRVWEVKVPNSLVVVAHLSEGIPRFWLIDQVSLETFVDNEMTFDLQLGVEAKALTDINATSGIQTQAYAPSVLTTLRNGLTTLEIAGTPLARWRYTPWTGMTWSWRGPPATPSST